MIRIGIDYRFALKSTRGIAGHIQNLVEELMELDHENQYILYTDQETDQALPPNFQFRKLARTNIIWFEQYILPCQARKDRIQVLWYPSNSGPLFLHRKIKLVLTIHDLIFLHRPGKTGFKFRHRLGEYYRALSLKLGIGRADQLLTVSNFSRQEILRQFKRDSQVIYNQIRPSKGEESSCEAVMQRLSVNPHQYIYSISGPAPHKNNTTLIHLFNGPLKNHTLVLSGINDPSDQQKLGQLVQYNNVIFTGYLPEPEKNCLLANCSLFLFLSLYEGFGLPLVEAMAAGCPILASNQGAIAEIVGGAGELVDPINTAAIAQRAEQIITGPAKSRAAATEKQLLLFTSWKHAARQLQAVFLTLVP